MPTQPELARDFAAQITHAVRSVRNDGVKVASASPTLQAAVKDVLRQLDGLVYEQSRAPVSDSYKEQLRALIDQELGLRPGTMEIVKRGSVSSTLQFGAALDALLLQVVFE